MKNPVSHSIEIGLAKHHAMRNGFINTAALRVYVSENLFRIPGMEQTEKFVGCERRF